VINIIDNLPLTDFNYDHSVALLKERFRQPYKLVNAHIDALMNLPKPVNNLASLQVFHDKLANLKRLTLQYWSQWSWESFPPNSGNSLLETTIVVSGPFRKSWPVFSRKSEYLKWVITLMVSPKTLLSLLDPSIQQLQNL